LRERWCGQCDARKQQPPPGAAWQRDAAKWGGGVLCGINLFVKVDEEKLL
jgi:hypothetical protein